MKIEVELDYAVPDGWEAVRVARAKPMEHYLNTAGGLSQWGLSTASSGMYCIVRKVQKWRKASPADLVGGPVECRFRKEPLKIWAYGKYSGYRAFGSCNFLCSRGSDYEEYFQYCEVLDTLG